MQQHVIGFNDRVLKLEGEEDNATSAEEYFQIRREISPIYRTAQHMSVAISRAYEDFSDDRYVL